ncbi:MAG: hypothetical protein HHJ16_13670, partial [Polaromonas sp.]|uniref:hypothetical protein n=1 Tax=Polaromonas sp. TaxID=1869339 RepID=UPI00180510EE
FLIATASLAFASTQSYSQKLAPTSRSVFKCEVAGKVVYSDSPCLGAQKIDVEPTRGLSKTSGREQVGNDVRREQHREMFAEAIRPLTGMNAKQLDVQGRRMKLTADARQECRRLDAEIPVAEKQERLVKQQALADVQAQLLRMRRSFREQSC